MHQEHMKGEEHEGDLAQRKLRPDPKKNGEEAEQARFVNRLVPGIEREPFGNRRGPVIAERYLDGKEQWLDAVGMDEDCRQAAGGGTRPAQKKGSGRKTIALKA